MSQLRSDAGSNKRVVIMLIMIVVMGGIYAAMTLTPDTLRSFFADEPAVDSAPWEDAAAAPTGADTGGAPAADTGVATQKVVKETADLQEQLEREQQSLAGVSDALPNAAQAPSPAMASANVGLDYSALDPATREMMDLKRVLDLANTNLQVQQAQAAIEEARRQTEGVRLGTNVIPMLVGVSGSRSRGLRAEFHLGGSQRVALVSGRWITPDWKLVSVDAAGAEVENAKGERTRLVLGTRPVQAQSTQVRLPASAAQPMMPAVMPPISR
jgi:hypothetical protein